MKQISNNTNESYEKKNRRKQSPLGAFTGAVAVLCVATVTTKTNAADSGDNNTKAKEIQMEQVTGIGGVFFKAKDRKGLAAWYGTNLGIQSKGGHADELVCWAAVLLVVAMTIAAVQNSSGPRRN